MSTGSIRRQLNAIRAGLEADQPDERPLITFDELLALPPDAPERGSARLDYDSLCASGRPERDASTLPDLIGDRLRAIAAELGLPPADHHPPPGFVQVPVSPSPNDPVSPQPEGESHDGSN
jgi:hypothetical protein